MSGLRVDFGRFTYHLANSVVIVNRNSLSIHEQFTLGRLTRISGVVG